MSSITSLNFMVENGLNLRDVVTTGSVLHINTDNDEVAAEPEIPHLKSKDILGQPVSNLKALSESMVAVDNEGLVKKKILNEGGGIPIHNGCTVSVAYSGYFENEHEPFDVVPVNKPLVVDLNDHGLLPGLEIATKSMLVDETSVFLFSYKVMYGEMGIPPRIKPKAECVFYIKLVKSILTPKDGHLDFSEANIFQRVNHEVKLLYVSGTSLYKSNNFMAAIKLFRKAVNMLHKCRLANEAEEKQQENFLEKIYINLVICYNKINEPLMVCTACNELNRLNRLWNNGKVLFHNAKALRIIGDYVNAEKKLLRAKKLMGDKDVIKTEYELLKAAQEKSEQVAKEIQDLPAVDLVSNEFKQEVDEFIRNFKFSEEKNEITLPPNLNMHEMAYIKKACIRNNLFINQLDGVDNTDNKVN